jgi:uncharacterized protein
MNNVDYFKIIHKYIPQDSVLYQPYITHSVLVTAKALNIAKRLGLSHEQQRFIEEGAMLHDIGIVKVEEFSDPPEKNLPYICHLLTGKEILEQEGLPRHARVAERHVLVGLSKEEIIEHELPLPHRDLIPKSIEEKIVAWADLFYSKHAPRLWEEYSVDEVQQKLKRFGERQERVFQEWLGVFGDTASA